MKEHEVVQNEPCQAGVRTKRPTGWSPAIKLSHQRVLAATIAGDDVKEDIRSLSDAGDIDAFFCLDINHRAVGFLFGTDSQNDTRGVAQDVVSRASGTAFV